MTQPKQGLAGLLARVEKAEGSDRELDARFWCLGEGVKFSHLSSQREAIIFFRPGQNGSCREDGRTPYTTSLDAALALCERVLPGWLREVSEQSSLRWMAEVMEGGDAEISAISAAKTPALALLAAMLRALIAQSSILEEG